jgi:hypothetical protein
MNYPLAAASIPRPACKRIQPKAINASLSKCGFNRKTSRAIVFGAAWCVGLGWRHICFEQGILHILTIIKHLRTPGPFQSLLQICLDWCQVVAGVSFSPMRVPTIVLSCVDCPWMDFNCAFLRHCSAQLLTPGITLPKPQRQHDVCTMEGIVDLNLSAANDDKRLNACRLWLQVTTLSDISTLMGDRIDRTAWLCLLSLTSNQAEWPRPDSAMQRGVGSVAQGPLRCLLHQRVSLRLGLQAWSPHPVPWPMAARLLATKIAPLGHLRPTQLQTALRSRQGGP